MNLLQEFVKSNHTTIDSLALEDQERIAELVEGCLRELEEGKPIEIERLVSNYRNLEKPLRRCLAGLQTLHDAVHNSHDTLPIHSTFRSGDRLGDFTLNQVIGRGGMGVVYAAHQNSLNRQVAVKLLPIDIIPRPKLLQRFRLEAQSAAQLQHPNIVPVYAVGEESGVHYYAMRLIDGQSLDQVDHSRWLEQGMQAFLDVAIAIADALQHSHECGIIHRDIKPSNLLIDKQDKVWITDFGLARYAQEQDLTRTGELVGTLNYMSPEQALGQPVDERTDIYSLGATFYEMLTGQPAIHGENHADSLRKIDQQSPIPPRNLQPSIPFDLETIVLKSISKNRENRYTSAASMAADLRAVKNGLPIAGRRPSLGKVAVDWINRHRSLVIVAMGGIGATLLTLCIGLWQVWSTRNDLRDALDDSQANFETAQSNYWQGRNLLDRWNETLIQELIDVPGAESVRSQMLADTIEYYKWFLQQSTDDPQLEDDIVNARLRLAAAYVHADDQTQAMSHYRRAIDDLSGRDGVLPPPRQCQLAMAYNDLAVVQLRLSDANAAIENLYRAVAINDSLINQLPDELEPLANGAAALVNLAKAHQYEGHVKQQTESLDRAVKMYRDAVARAPQNLRFQSELGIVLDHQSVLLSTTDLKSAIELGEEAAKFHVHCLQAETKSIPYSRRYAASLHNLAVFNSKQSDFKTSRLNFLDAIAVREKLTRWYPSQPDYWSELAISHNGLAMLQCQNQSWNEAERSFEIACDALQVLINDLDSRPIVAHQLALAGALTNLTHLRSRRTGTLPDAESLGRIEQILAHASQVANNPDEVALLQQARSDLQKLQASSTAGVDELTTTGLGT